LPYIKPERRPKHNQAIKKMLIRFKQHEDNGTLNVLQFNDILNKLDWIIMTDVDEKSYDGEMNYFLTKLTKDIGWLTGKPSTKYWGMFKVYEKLRDDVVNFFMSLYHPNSYYDFNRMMGVCITCIQEMKRRYGSRASMAMAFVNMVMDGIFEKLVPHEIKKIEENGDV
jgi:hypothetical protein